MEQTRLKKSPQIIINSDGAFSGVEKNIFLARSWGAFIEEGYLWYDSVILVV